MEKTQRVSHRYKERLQTKYLKGPTNKISSVSSCLRFVNMRIDDFGDYSSVLSRAQGGLSLVIFQGTLSHSSTQKPQKSIPKEHACFSKQMIRKQIHRVYVAAVVAKLKQHPLAVYPHYKDHMTPELFDKVVSVLSPDMCTNSTSSFPTADQTEEDEVENCTEPSREDVKRTKQVNPPIKSTLMSKIQVQANLLYNK